MVYLGCCVYSQTVIQIACCCFFPNIRFVFRHRPIIIASSLAEGTSPAPHGASRQSGDPIRGRIGAKVLVEHAAPDSMHCSVDALVRFECVWIRLGVGFEDAKASGRSESAVAMRENGRTGSGVGLI